MRGPRVSVTAAGAVYSLIVFLVAHRTVSTEIECGSRYMKRDDSWPDYLFCVGDGDHGNWTRLEGNGSQHLIASFNKTYKEVKDSGYSVWVYIAKENRTGTFLRRNGREEDAPFARHGTYFCSIGNETCQIDVLMPLQVYAYSSQGHLELECQPPITLMVTENYPNDKKVYKYPPYNITWYVNSTLVGRSTDCNGTWCGVSYERNSTYVRHHNVTIHGDTANTTNDKPLCLSCLLNTTDGSGINVVCSPRTKDPSLLNTSGVGLFGGNLGAVRDERPDEDPPNGGGLPGGALVFIVSIMIVGAIAGVLFLATRVRERTGRTSDGFERIVYRPLVGRSVGTRGRDEP